jgi:hypothetical protein
MDEKDRSGLLEIFKQMPDEAFSYIVLACVEVVKNNEANHGFTPKSTTSFVGLALAINGYIGGELIDMSVVKSHNPILFPEVKA